MLEQHEIAGGGTHQFNLKGYRFDSGLHYTVPWSVPIFALTCLKKQADVCIFDLMGDSEGVVDRINLVFPRSCCGGNDGGGTGEEGDGTNIKRHHTFSFDMQHGEEHIQMLYEKFPEEQGAIKKFLSVSDKSMVFVKLFLLARLLPKQLQQVITRCVHLLHYLSYIFAYSLFYFIFTFIFKLFLHYFLCTYKYSTRILLR